MTVASDREPALAGGLRYSYLIQDAGLLDAAGGRIRPSLVEARGLEGGHVWPELDKDLREAEQTSVY